MSRAVLLVSNEQDIGADYVVAELGRRAIPALRLNTEQLADWRVQLRPGHRWRIARGDRSLDSSECSGVWWRRPESPLAPAAVASAEWDAVTAQWRALTEGLVSVPGPRWVSDPLAIRRAENKALQLQQAAAVGFQVPQTVWTNDVDAAREFVADAGGHAIVKSVATAYWEHDDTSAFVFAKPVALAQLPEGRRLASAPRGYGAD